jgi:hypothetical protein
MIVVSRRCSAIVTMRRSRASALGDAGHDLFEFAELGIVEPGFRPGVGD